MTVISVIQGGDVDSGLGQLEASAKALIDDLLWWTAALKNGAQSRVLTGHPRGGDAWRDF